MSFKQAFSLKRKQISGKDRPYTLGDFLNDKEEKQATITGVVYDIEIDRILPNTYQPRKYFGETALAELAESIKQNGVIQPIVIRQDKVNELYLVAGERRLMAVQMTGLVTITAIFTDGNPIEISLIENLRRENLKPVEEAEALGKMIREFEYTRKDVARII